MTAAPYFIAPRIAALFTLSIMNSILTHFHDLDDFCVSPRYTDNSILLIRCSKTKAKGRSWHLTQDNSFLRQAGSNMVLSVTSANSGEGAIIAQMNSSGLSQKWSIEKTH